MIQKNKCIAVIPARYGSSRLPGKLLKTLGNKSVIQHVYDNVVSMRIFDKVVIACDKDIYDRIDFQCDKILTGDHENGTSRIIEVAESNDADIIVNVQGDEPFVRKNTLGALLEAFLDPSVMIATLISLLKDVDALHDYNRVKVVTDINGNALYFSRQAIPAQRDKPYRLWTEHHDYYIHHGIYAFRKDTLVGLKNIATSPIGRSESLEQLDWIYNDLRIKCVVVDESANGIDTIEDLEKAQEYLSTLKKG